MIELDIPGRGTIELQHAVFDMNGTLTIDGELIPGVADHLEELAAQLSIHVLTAGTHGNVEEIARILDLPLHLIQSGEEKTQYVQQLDAAHVIAFGNGANDAGMLRVAVIGVAILAAEGAAASALQAADVVTLGPIDAIDLLLKPKRLVATLRG